MQLNDSEDTSSMTCGALKQKEKSHNQWETQ